MRSHTLLAALAVLLAGCASPEASHGGHGDDATLDTGDIAPGASATLTFAEAGQVTIHCHPHPFMEHVVTVTDDAPGEAHVHVYDGDDPAEYRYEPSSLAVGVGSVVTYHNHGNLTHTATRK